MDILSTRSISSSTLWKRARYFCFKLEIHCELESPARSDSQARFPFIALGYKSSSGSIYHITQAWFLFIARMQIELESDIVELSELQIFCGGVGGSDSCKEHKNVSTNFFFCFVKFFFSIPSL